MILQYAAILIGLLISWNGKIDAAGEVYSEMGSQSLEMRHQMHRLKIKVLYHERSLLPPDSRVIVTLEDISKMDVASEILAKKTVPINGAPPFNLSLEYDVGKLHDKGRYSIRARIERNDQLLFINTQSVSAFNGDTGQPIDIWVEAIARKPCETSSYHANLVNTYWKLITLFDVPVTIGAENQELFMVLTSNKLRVRGFSGCNRFSGHYDLQQEKLSFNGIASTKKRCIESMEQERRFLDALSSTAEYQIEGENLELFDQDHFPVAAFESRYMQ